MLAVAQQLQLCSGRCGGKSGGRGGEEAEGGATKTEGSKCIDRKLDRVERGEEGSKGC